MRLCLIVAAGLLMTDPAAAQVPIPPPVAAVVDGRLPVAGGILPVFLSQDWSRPLPAVRRVVVVVHGYERDADPYARIVMRAEPPADTLVVAPQFLAVEDIAAHGLPDEILRWQRGLWSGGFAADGPVPLSPFDALDALLAKAGDPSVLPAVSRVVVAGFSAGGQLVQRYAAVGRGESAFARDGIHLRVVVASQSAYVYFGGERPQPTAGCAGFNNWRYGFAAGLPPYVAAAAATGVEALERRYVQRDIFYLVGADDNDPNHRFLDRSCAAAAQGANRLERMRSFLSSLRRRDGDPPQQRLAIVGGAAHQAARVLGSPCGRAALFDTPGCASD